jgi:hypothetical protein
VSCWLLCYGPVNKKIIIFACLSEVLFDVLWFSNDCPMLGIFSCLMCSYDLTQISSLAVT